MHTRTTLTTAGLLAAAALALTACGSDHHAIPAAPAATV